MENCGNQNRGNQEMPVMPTGHKTSPNLKFHKNGSLRNLYIMTLQGLTFLKSGKTLDWEQSNRVNRTRHVCPREKKLGFQD